MEEVVEEKRQLYCCSTQNVEFCALIKSKKHTTVKLNKINSFLPKYMD